MSLNLLGTITKVTDDGRGAIVLIDNGGGRAVINDDTNGRLGLMTANPSGQLKTGQRVTIHAARRGPEALVALRVS